MLTAAQSDGIMLYTASRFKSVNIIFSRSSNQFSKKKGWIDYISHLTILENFSRQNCRESKELPHVNYSGSRISHVVSHLVYSDRCRIWGLPECSFRLCFSSYILYYLSRCRVNELLKITCMDRDTTEDLPWCIFSRFQGPSPKTTHDGTCTKDNKTQKHCIVMPWNNSYLDKKQNPTANPGIVLGPLD